MSGRGKPGQRPQSAGLEIEWDTSESPAWQPSPVRERVEADRLRAQRDALKSAIVAGLIALDDGKGPEDLHRILNEAIIDHWDRRFNSQGSEAPVRPPAAPEPPDALPPVPTTRRPTRATRDPAADAYRVAAPPHGFLGGRVHVLIACGPGAISDVAVATFTRPEDAEAFGRWMAGL